MTFVINQMSMKATMTDIGQFNFGLVEPRNPHDSLRNVVEKRLLYHRSSNSDLHTALKRLHQLRVQKKHLDQEIIKFERVLFEEDG
jgi:hypothetical protein